jgi:hypothetical protein
VCESPEDAVDFGPLKGCSRFRGIIFKTILKCPQGRLGFVQLVLVHEEESVITKRFVLRKHPLDQYVVHVVLLSLIKASVCIAKFDNCSHRVLRLNEGAVEVVPQASPLVANTLCRHSTTMAQTEVGWLSAQTASAVLPF